MTDADFFAFASLVRSVCQGRLRAKLPTHDELRAMFALVQDLSFEAFERGIRGAAQREKYFTDVPTIRQYVARRPMGARPVITPETAAALAEGDVYCRECEDTGWAYRHGRGGPGVSLEDAVRLANGDRWAVRCPCRPTNPLYQACRIGGAPEAS